MSEDPILVAARELISTHCGPKRIINISKMIALMREAFPHYKDVTAIKDLLMAEAIRQNCNME